MLVLQGLTGMRETLWCTWLSLFCVFFWFRLVIIPFQLSISRSIKNSLIQGTTFTMCNVFISNLSSVIDIKYIKITNQFTIDVWTLSDIIVRMMWSTHRCSSQQCLGTAPQGSWCGSSRCGGWREVGRLCSQLVRNQNSPYMLGGKLKKQQHNALYSIILTLIAPKPADSAVTWIKSKNLCSNMCSKVTLRKKSNSTPTTLTGCARYLI